MLIATVTNAVLPESTAVVMAGAELLGNLHSANRRVCADIGEVHSLNQMIPHAAGRLPRVT